MKSKNIHHYKKPTIIANKTKRVFLLLNEADISNLLSYVCCTDQGESCVSTCTVCHNCNP